MMAYLYNVSWGLSLFTMQKMMEMAGGYNPSANFSASFQTANEEEDGGEDTAEEAGQDVAGNDGEEKCRTT